MLIISDLHWRCDTPSWRKEANYSADVLRPQLAACLALGQPVVVAGDVFHRAADFEATYDLFCFLKEQGAVLYAVRGQHDMIDHADAQQETGFNLLVKAGLIIPLGARTQIIDGWRVCGMGWGEPKPTTNADILIAHVSLSHGDAVIRGASTAEEWARSQRFPLSFTGDNHIRFSIPGVYNAGCFHQMTADLEDQAPAAWHLAPELKVTLLPIPCKPPMIDLSRRSEEKGKAVAGVEFTAALAKARQQGGGDIFIATLAEAALATNKAQADLLTEIIKQCKEEHT